MHDELFEKPTLSLAIGLGRMSRLASASCVRHGAEGYSRSTLKRIAWVLLIVAEAVHSHGGSISVDQLEKLNRRRIRLGNGRRPSGHTAKLFRRFGEDWLRSIGALLPEADPPPRFARELDAFTEYMRVERGLSPVTIATREERMRWFFASLPSRVRSLARRDHRPDRRVPGRRSTARLAPQLAACSG